MPATFVFSSLSSFSGTSRGSLAAFSAMRIHASITGWNSLWPNITAPSITSSDNSSASDSTIRTASCVPATTKSSDVSSICSIVGFNTYSPFIKPTRAPPIGPWNGTPEIVKAAETATRATISASFSRSWLTTVAITCVSFLKPLTKSGRMGRSIRRETNVSFSLGRPSRLK